MYLKENEVGIINDVVVRAVTEYHGSGCKSCVFYNGKTDCGAYKLCSSVHREDKKEVCFVKVDEYRSKEEDLVSPIENQHYEKNGSIDPIDLMRVSGDLEGFLAGNVVKYVARRNNKGQRNQDIIKAIDYMIMLGLESGVHAEHINQIVEKRKNKFSKK